MTSLHFCLAGPRLGFSFGAQEVSAKSYGPRAIKARVRVIYYFHSDLMPLYLVTVFGKNDKSNLTAEECSQLAALVERLTSIWIRKKR